MKKLILFFIAIVLIISPSYADGEEWWEAPLPPASFSYDLFLRANLVRGDDVSVGGGISLGLQTPNFKFEAYCLADWYLNPLGGSGGAATLEVSVEPGASFYWQFLQVWRTRHYLGIDIGYYMQLTSIYQNPAAGVFMGHNGIVLRPKYVTEFQIAKHYSMSIGIYYQVAILPDYSDYNGFGIMVSIL